MRPRFVRPVFVLIMSLAALAVGSIASATPPSDLRPLGPSLPSCTASAPDTGGAHICWVTPLRDEGWQASTGEWIVVRVGDLEPTQELCEQAQASVVATITLDDRSLPVDTISCHAVDGGWFVDWRGLSEPLPPGTHTFSETWHFTTTGDTFTFGPQTLVVMPGG
jgi:hypothetical protein